MLSLRSLAIVIAPLTIAACGTQAPESSTLAADGVYPLASCSNSALGGHLVVNMEVVVQGGKAVEIRQSAGSDRGAFNLRVRGTTVLNANTKKISTSGSIVGVGGSVTAVYLDQASKKVTMDVFYEGDPSSTKQFKFGTAPTACQISPASFALL